MLLNCFGDRYFFEIATDWKDPDHLYVYVAEERGMIECAQKLHTVKMDKEQPVDLRRLSDPVYMNTQKGMEIVLKDRKHDFYITSKDSTKFPVHSFLLESLWPFFLTASTIDMVEKETQTLELPYSKESVQVLVDYFYGIVLLNYCQSLQYTIFQTCKKWLLVIWLLILNLCLSQKP